MAFSRSLAQTVLDFGGEYFSKIGKKHIILGGKWYPYSAPKMAKRVPWLITLLVFNQDIITDRIYQHKGANELIACWRFIQLCTDNSEVHESMIK